MYIGLTCTMLFCKVMSASVSVTLLQPPLITPTSSGPEVSSLSRFLRIAALTHPLHWRSHKLIHDNMSPIEQPPPPSNSYIVSEKGGILSQYYGICMSILAQAYTPLYISVHCISNFLLFNVLHCKVSCIIYEVHREELHDFAPQLPTTKSIHSCH